PAKVSQVRITDIEKRQMDVIVTEDQLSLAIGKRGQNVRLATRLVDWDINIVSEDVLKKEITQQMGQMMASGEAVPITAIQGVTANQAEILGERGVTDVEGLAAMSLDDLVETLDLSLDEGQAILDAAGAIVSAKNAQVAGESADEGSAESEAVTEMAEEPAVTEEPSEAADAAETDAADAEIDAAPDSQLDGETLPETELLEAEAQAPDLEPEGEVTVPDAPEAAEPETEVETETEPEATEEAADEAGDDVDEEERA